MNVAISGANRGIGLEFCRQLLPRGDSIWAGVRDPKKAKDLDALATKHPNLHVLRLDVADEASVKAFASQCPPALELLINNAGVMGKEAAFEKYDFDDALQTLNVNALGALRVTRALLPALRKAKGARVVHITSGLGSIGDNSSGGYYAYRMSKAALNMGSRSLAHDLAGDRIVSAVVHPGWVQTDMGGRGAPTPVDESVRGMLAVIDELGPADSGKFFTYRGEQMEW